MQVELDCPLCDERHPYSIEIHSSIVLYAMHAGREPRTQTRSFTRLFLCPEKGKRFEAGVEISEPSYSRITDVIVKAGTDER